MLVDSFAYLDIFIQILKNNVLFARLSKCSYGLLEVNYLEHQVLGLGVMMDGSKFRAVME